eukprot:671408-Lingulodinium_polyedra.AAC.1
MAPLARANGPAGLRGIDGMDGSGGTIWEGWGGPQHRNTRAWLRVGRGCTPGEAALRPLAERRL